MRAGLEIVALGEIITFERGLTYAKGDEVPFSCNGVLRSNNVDLISQKLNLDEIKYLRNDFEIPDKKKVKKSSLLMCMSNGSKDHLGKVALIDRELDYAFGGFMGLLVPNENKVFPRYLYYALASKSFKDYIHSLADGANINNLKYKDLAAFPVPLPSLPEQQRIVDILDQEVAKIDALKANAKKSLQAAKDLFQATLRKELEPKEGWKSITLNDACIQMNGIWKGTKEPLVPAKILRTTNFSKDCRIKLDDLAIIDVEKKKLDARRLQRGDIIVEKSGGGPKQPVGRVILFDMDEDDFSFCNFTSALRIKDKEQVDYRYLHKYLTYLYIGGETEKYQSNLVGFRNLDFKGYISIEVPYPSFPEQQQIAEALDVVLEKLDDLTKNYQKTLSLCDDLKQALLHKAFNGEL